MTALAADRNTPTREGEMLSVGVATNIKIYGGAIVMKNAAGYATKGATATGQICLGRAEDLVDNTGGADGAKSVSVRAGVFKWANSAAGDLITIADVGNACYIVDDQTVAKTDAAGTRSAAGKIVAVDSDGVWVQMDSSVATKELLSVAAALDFPSLAAAASADLTIAVPGAAVGNSVSLGRPAAPTAGLIFQAFVSAADTVTVRATNITAGAVDAVSASYRVTVLKA